MKTTTLCILLLGLATGCEEPKKIVPMTISQPTPTSYTLTEAETQTENTYTLPEVELNKGYIDL